MTNFLKLGGGGVAQYIILNYYKPLYDVNFLQEHSSLKISCHESPLLPGLVDHPSYQAWCITPPTRLGGPPLLPGLVDHPSYRAWGATPPTRPWCITPSTRPGESLLLCVQQAGQQVVSVTINTLVFHFSKGNPGAEEASSYHGLSWHRGTFLNFLSSFIDKILGVKS